MTESIIIGIHGLFNKPPEDTLKNWWREALIEGAYRNCNKVIDPQFELAYWADIRNDAPDDISTLDEAYEPAPGEGMLERYDMRMIDKTREVSQKWAGKLFDIEKQLFGLGRNVEKLIGIKFDDLAEYYDKDETRLKMRAKLRKVIESHKDKRIMLLAHSMGSIIAYDVLREYDDSNIIEIEHFVTMGSPIGLPIVSINIQDEFGSTITPKIVKRWTNIADPGDKVSLDCNLADEYDAHHGVKVNDVLVHNHYVNHEGKANNHKSYGYLRCPELSDFIVEFLAV